MEFTLKELLELLKKRFFLIGFCTFVGLCFFFIISKYVMKPYYTASVQMYVNPNDSDASANLNELNYAQKVVTTYINFLQTKVFYEQVMQESNLDYTRDELKGMTTIQSINNTEIFQISVSSLDPYDSFTLVESMQKITPELIKNIKHTAEISVVDPVVLPTSPSSPNILFNAMIGGMLGLIFSSLAFILWEIIDVNVKSQEDLSKRYQLPILGAIPNFDSYKKRKYLLRKVMSIFRKHKKLIRRDKSINEDTKFIITEAYKSLRTNLRFTLRWDGCKKIIISSPIPEDGKSTTSANIAITIAQTGAKVLLIDCDMRKGRLHSFFDLKSAVGISDTLSGMIAVNDVIQDTSYKNLQVITIGSIPPNPAELLASIQMEELIKKLEKVYDYIIIDTPPVNVVSDVLSLVKLVNGVVIVVKEGNTSHPNIKSALTKYEFVEANILGFVINGVSLNQGQKSKYQYYQNKGKD